MSKIRLQLKSLIKPIYQTVNSKYWEHRGKSLGKLPNSDVPTVLFLLPEAGIKRYSQNFAMLASQLKMRNHRILFGRCFNLFERCVFMDSVGLDISATPQEKKSLCSMCIKSFEQNIVSQNHEYVDLRYFTQADDLNNVKQAIAEHSNQTFSFVLDDIDFSGLLEYNLFLYLKKTNLNSLDDAEISLWQQTLVSLVAGYKALERLTAYYDISHINMMEEYSLSLVVRELAARKGIDCKNISSPFHKDVDATQSRIIYKASHLENIDAIEHWDTFKKLSLPESLYKDITDDLIIRMSHKGVYSYSPNKSTKSDIISELALSHTKKTIVAFPSSPDEVDSLFNIYKKRKIELPSHKDAFQDQISWLDETINFIESTADFQLVIRLHPRMAPNHRESRGCLGISDFKNRFSRPYKQVKIIWPDENTSSYDLLEIADCVTVSWSSLGIFAARLGIPVITGYRRSLPLPNESFFRHCSEKGEYFKTMLELCSKKATFEDICYAYRWYHLMYLIYCIKLDDIWHNGVFDNSKQSGNGVVLENVLIHNENLISYKLKELENQQTFFKEHEAPHLLIQIFRIIHFFMTNQDNTEISHINIYIETEDRKQNHEIIDVPSVTIRDKRITYCHENTIYVKTSILIARLVDMIVSQRLYSNKDNSQLRAAVTMSKTSKESM